MASGIFKVRLVSALNNIATGDNRFRTQQVIFINTPQFSESGGVDYTPVMPIHMPGAIQVYKNTQARNFSISHKFISRTQQEASDNMESVQLLRSWRFPFFGIGSSTLTESQSDKRQQLTGDITAAERRLRGLRQEAAAAAAAQSQGAAFIGGLSTDQAARVNALRARRSSTGFELLGAPPEVLYLYAYSSPDTDRSRLQNIHLNKIPVVLTSLSITYPDDVDYIPNNDNQPCPVRWDVSLDLVETHSPREFERFSLLKYKTGQLDSF